MVKSAINEYSEEAGTGSNEKAQMTPRGVLAGGDSTTDTLLTAPTHSIKNGSWSRRQIVFGSIASTLGLALLSSTEAASAQATSSLLTSTIAPQDCLKDLPPFDPKTTVRLYLCRHGQTENNRLKLMQGARIDAPLNDTGEQQAMALGLALSGATVPPEQIWFSPLQRAKRTALLASQQFPSPTPHGQQLASLAELDFGETAESAPVESVRADMVAAYTAWDKGHLDARMAGGGETGLEMLQRVNTSLLALIDAASKTTSGCIAAVSHSAYLRMLLATVDDELSLLTASKMKLENCSVNVLDFRRSGVANKKIKGQVVRINEKRHLQSIIDV